MAKKISLILAVFAVLAIVGAGCAPVQPEERGARQEEKQTNETTVVKDGEQWKNYTNDKYLYSFGYPADMKLASQDGGDEVTLAGDLKQKGWPNIRITHFNTLAYNPPESADLQEWIKNQFGVVEKYFTPESEIFLNWQDGSLLSATLLQIPGSPQSYGRNEIYFLRDNKLFLIQMFDPSSSEAKVFYDKWLSSFYLAPAS